MSEMTDIKTVDDSKADEMADRKIRDFCQNG
jgi:hypothetical protein